jgi:hypothetical protein
MSKSGKLVPVSKSFDTGNARSDPDDLGDYDAVKKLTFAMLESGGYWHDRIKSVLAAAGLTTTRIQREDEHPTVWFMWLTRTSMVLDADKKTASKQIRKLLVKGGIKILPTELSVIDRRGDKLRCAFVLELGTPGGLN